jgi:hypothetical protein
MRHAPELCKAAGRTFPSFSRPDFARFHDIRIVGGKRLRFCFVNTMAKEG